MIQSSTLRTLIRPIVPSDINDIYRGLSHPDVIRFYGVSFHSLQATEEQMQWYADLEKNKTGQWWAIIDKENDSFIGAGGFNDWDHTHRKAEVGFWLLPEFWRKGYMRECMTAILNQGFNHLKMHRIEGFIDPDNQACLAGVEKLGFTHEGTLRSAEFKDGRWLDIDIWSVLSTDALSWRK